MNFKGKKQILKDNMLIAEFVSKVTGERIILADDFNKLGEASYTGENKGVKWLILEYRRYHSSWQDLMDVVEAIERSPDYPFFVHIMGNACWVTSSKSEYVSAMRELGWIVSSSELFDYTQIHPPKVEAVYKTVLEFIKWFNSFKTETNGK